MITKIKVTKHKQEMTRESVEAGERQINDILQVLEAYTQEHKTDINVLISAMIAVIGCIIASTALHDIDHQDKLIEFITKAIRVSLAENGYRTMSSDLDDAIPPWEKN
jgi:hypothetical protein